MNLILFSFVIVCIFANTSTAYAQGSVTPGSDYGTLPGTTLQDTNTATTPTGSISESKNFNQGKTSCESIGFSNFGTCAGRFIAVYTATGLINLTGWLLGTAGVLLNTALEFTITGFHANIYSNIESGVKAVWTAFRDIANILIIGMFTYTAIAMILGIESFSARKTVAKILLIAILINFSLLFTRLIIGSSNFVANEFYKAAAFYPATANQLPGAGATRPYDQYAAGISGRFAQLMGVGGSLAPSEALWKVSEKTDNGFIALVQGLFTATIFFAAALVFLYAAFLLIARAILFIVLLITSSLAFATHLVPNKLLGGYGWEKWWSSLLKNAIFGPLLLMLLWATLTLGEGIKKLNNDQTLGALLVDPAKGGAINTLFSYLLILGMLYASIKIASSFAGKIAGFNYGALAPAIGIAGISRMAGFGAKIGVGGSGNYIGRKLQEASQNEDRSNMSRQLFDFSAKPFKKLAKSEFNAMRTPFGKEIQSLAGFKKLDDLAGKAPKKTGYSGMQERRAESYAEQAERMKTTPGDVAKIRAEATSAMTKSESGLGKEHKDTKEVASSSEKELRGLESKQKETIEAFNKNLGALTGSLAKARSEAVAGGRDIERDPTVERLNREIEREKSTHKSDLRTQQARIDTAREHSKNATAAHENVKEKIKAAVEAQVPEVSDFAHKRFSNLLARAVGLSNKDNDQFLKLVDKEFKGKGEKKRLKDLAAIIADESPKPAAAPITPSTK